MSALLNARGDLMPPGSGRVDWDRVRESIRLHLIERGKVEDPDAEIPEAEVAVIEPGHLIPVSELNAQGKSLAARFEAKNLKVQVLHSTTHHSDVLYLSDSKEGDKNQHRRGDIRTPSEYRDHFQLRASIHHGAAALGYRFIWERREGKGFAFKGGWSRDTVTGIFFSSKLAEFEQELDMRFPPLKPRAPRKKKDERTVDEKLLAGEDWAA